MLLLTGVNRWLETEVNLWVKIVVNPWQDDNVPGRLYMWLQYSALRHNSKRNYMSLSKIFPDIVGHNFLPPLSSECKLIDYYASTYLRETPMEPSEISQPSWLQITRMQSKSFPGIHKREHISGSGHLGPVVQVDGGHFNPQS